MGKCGACQENKCQGKYENRSTCEGNGCTCTCQESKADTFVKGFLSIAGGTACVAAGVAIDVVSIGTLAPIGGAFIGAGSSLMTNPIEKQITGERMTGGDLLNDVAVGSVVGALSGGIGAGGSVLSKGASGVTKFVIRVGAGAASGAVGGAVSETARAMNGEKVTLGSFAKSVGVGIVCGGVGGSSSHLASNASKGFSNGVAKATTRVVVQTSTAAATDAGIQLCETGGDVTKFDPKRLLLTATSQATVATTAECARNGIIKLNIYADNMNKKLAKEVCKKTAAGPDQDNLKKELYEAMHEANRLEHETINEQGKKVQGYNKMQSDITELKGTKNNLEQKLDKVKTEMNKLKGDMSNHNEIPDKIKLEMKEMARVKNEVREEIKSTNQKLETLQQQASAARPDNIGEKNLHFLRGERTGQIAMDVPDENNNRGPRRLIADQKAGNKFLLADYTPDHNYDGLNKPGQKQYYDPLDALPADQFNKKNKKKEKD